MAANPNSILNTVLITVLLGLSGWTLHEVNQQGKDAAKVDVRMAQVEKENIEARLKMASIELTVANLRLDMVRFGWTRDTVATRGVQN